MSILATTSAAVIPAGTWSIDPDHSAVEFEVTYLGLAAVKGRAARVEGAIRGGEEPSIQGTVAVNSITTLDETRDVHLQSPDFFDAERHPTLRFESTGVGGEDGRLVVHGNLTIKGITQPVDLVGRFAGVAVDPWGNERIGLSLSGVIDRTEFGVSWNAPLPDGGFLLPDEVTISASFSAVKAR
jgi:polyisoprenoid-binding protein YceI